MSDSVQPLGLQPTRLLLPWDSPGKNTGVGCHFLLQCMKVESESEVSQSCPTLSDLMDCSLPGSSIHGIFWATVLEWGAIAFSGIRGKCGLKQMFGLVIFIKFFWVSLVTQQVKNSPAMMRCKELGFDPWVRKILWRRKWQSTPVF